MIERNIKYFDIPFKHAVIDNFFSDQDYSTLTNILEENEKNIPFRYGSILDDSKDADQVHDWSENPDEILAPYFEYIASLESLKLDPEREFSTQYRYYIRSKNSDFNLVAIHTENIYKAMSLVVYIGNEPNYGTQLFDNDRNFVKEIEWKDNRAFIMCGYSNQKGKLPGNSTWHGYSIKPNTIRRTIFGYVLTTDKSCQRHSLAPLYSGNYRKYVPQSNKFVVLERYPESEGILFGKKFPKPKNDYD